MSLSHQETAIQEAHIEDDRRLDLIIAVVVCLVAACFAVALRFVSRLLAKARLRWDDWMIVIGLVRIS